MVVGLGFLLKKKTLGICSDERIWGRLGEGSLKLVLAEVVD